MQSFYQVAPEKLERQELSEDQLISGLFDYIKENKTFTEFFAAIEEKPEQHQQKLQALQDAINKADFKAQILDDSDATKYLVYLIKNKTIKFSLGMTVYIYLLAEGQFNDKPHLKKKEQKICPPRPLQMHALVANNELTTFAVTYLELVKTKLAERDIKFDIEKAKQHILALPPFEQHLLTMPDYRQQSKGFHFGQFFQPVATDNTYNHRYDYLLNVSDDATAIFTSENKDTIHLPSYSLINHIFSQMQAIPLQMKPIFGSVGLNTLTKLHAQDQHPVDIYSKSVGSNPKYVHDVKCGPIPALIHDICHCYWGNLLTHDERMFIQQELLPAVRRTGQKIRAQIGEVKPDRQSSAIVSLVNLHQNIDDYNLSAAGKYEVQATRLEDYIADIMFYHSSIYGPDRSLLYNAFLPELDTLFNKYANDITKVPLLKALLIISERFNDQRTDDNKRLQAK